MSSSSHSDNERILLLVGSIVLVSQDAERYLKAALPFIDSKNPDLGAVLRRHERLKRRTLGELTGLLVGSSSDHSPGFAQHMTYLVDARNQVVHHFNETYGARIAAGAHREVMGSLETLLANLRGFRASLELLVLAVLEGLRDVTFRNTPEFEQISALCASFRDRVAS